MSGYHSDFRRRVKTEESDDSSMSYDGFQKPLATPGAGAQGQGVDPKVLEFIQMQQATEQMYQQVERLSEMCWDTCDINPKDRLDGKQETCLTNCVQRYFDTANYVANRFMTKVQQSQQH